MTRLRERGAVDYTDLFSPAAKELPTRKKQGGKRKAREEEEEEEEPRKKERSKKKKKQKEEEEEKLPTEVKTKTKRKEEEPKEDKPKTKRKEKRRADEEEEEEEEDKNKRVVEKTVKRVSEAGPKSSKTDAVATENGSSELGDLRKKYDALREFRELETERLLREAKELARDEKRTYERLVAKLKSEVATLAARAERSEEAHQKKCAELEAEHTERLEALKRERRDAQETNEQLRKQVRELEAVVAASKRQTRQLTASSSDVAGSVHVGEVSVELTQAKRLLELYRLVTSTELRLIEALDDDDDPDADNYTDVACAVVDSVTGKRFTFDLAVPHNDSEEVEYVPSDQASNDFKTPSYLREELSFKRAELTKFMRTVLDVVIRKKKSSESAKHNR